jgi:hypothetical protein
MAKSRNKRRRDLAVIARQANHVLATAVVVFTAAMLLGRLTDPWMLSLQAWLRDHLGANVTALVFGPFIMDTPKALVLLGVAFPLGRVTTPRPWPASVGLVALVYGFDFSIDYVLGAHLITWLQWKALVGRGILAAGVTWGVAALLARGCRAAYTADRRGAELDPSDDDDPDVDDPDVDDPDVDDPDVDDPDVEDSTHKPTPEPTCKQSGTSRVSKGEP